MDILRDHCDDVSIETFTASLDELANSIAHHISQNGKVNHSCGTLTEGRFSECQITYHVNLCRNVSSSVHMHNCRCTVDGITFCKSLFYFVFCLSVLIFFFKYFNYDYNYY